jgi:hypothetical protein
MKYTLCPIALISLSALAAGSLMALSQPGGSGTTHKSGNQPGGPKGNDPEHPGTNMQDAGKPGADPIKQMQEMMAALNAPGPNSKFLEKWVGRWDTTSKIFMPGGPAQESHGHSEFRWAVDGRWLEERSEGQMMGMPSKGVGLLGYDAFNKKFVGSWVDNLNPGMIVGSGSLDQTGKVLTMFSQVDEPTTGEHGKTVRSQTTVIDDDTHRLVVDEVQYGQPFTVAEVTYKRVK